MPAASAGYYQAGGTALAAGIQNNGHPSDAWGFAVGGGFELRDVLGMKGDSFGMQVNYTRGAAGYVTRATGPTQMYAGNMSAGFGWLTDGVFTTGSSVALTTVWGLSAAFQHFWNPKWRTSLYGGYDEVDYGGSAQAMICPGGAAGSPVAIGTALAGLSNCNPNYSWWEVATRTQWNPHPDLDIGVDVVWDHLNTAFAGTATLAANGARPAGVYSISDQDVLSVYFRIQRNFLP